VARYIGYMGNRKPDGPLRKGWTTGACATAAATAAYEALVTGSFPDPITIALPKGLQPSFTLKSHQIGDDWARASVIKDAGDDPDVTHGAEIVATVKRGADGSGITFHAGDGVGTVTLPGLPLPVGEPAINPKPREIMCDNLRTRAATLKGPADLAVTIAIPGGELLAEKTMNGRLGIKGGLSVLGTTGIVIPYSCSSWIHSIQRGVDVARAGGITHIAAATGSTSEAAIQKMLGLPETALIDMGDFAGGLLKYLRENPVPRLTLAGGFGKITKLSQGALDLHSSRSRVDMAKLAQVAVTGGGSADLASKIEAANTALEAFTLATSDGIHIASTIARQAREVAMATVSGNMEIHVVIFDRQGQLIGQSDG
jgi:cobalt-precorrin-5B (C1)-methyltransferase